MKFTYKMFGFLLLSTFSFSETVYNKNINLDQQLEKIRKMKAANSDGAAVYELEKQKLNGEIEVAKLQAERDIQYGTASRLDALQNEVNIAIKAQRYQNELSIQIKAVSGLGRASGVYVDANSFDNAISQLVNIKQNQQILQKNLNLIKSLKKTANIGIIKKYIDKIELETNNAIQQQSQATISSGSMSDMSGMPTTATTTTVKAGNIKINTNQKIYGFITTKVVNGRVYFKAN